MIINRSNTVYLVAILITLFSISCNTSPKEQPVFSTTKMMSDLTEGVILPSIKDFVDQALLLDKQIQHFAQDITEENLVNAQQQWKNTASSYANIYAFNIGIPKKKFMHHLLYNWPVFVKDIDKALTEDKEVAIAKFSTRSKGLTGIEYLLFVSNDRSKKEIIALFQSNPKRISYLKQIADDFKSQALRLSDIWNGEQEKYKEVFVNNTETGLRGSLNMLCNGLFNVIETVKKAKLGKPAGLQGTSNTNYDLLQAYRSEMSLDLIRNNIQSIERTYFNTSGLGISDNVSFITKSNAINDKIKKQFDAIYSAMDQIDVPLRIGIDQQKNQVENMFNQIKELVWIFNNEVRSPLSIIVTPTDNDGD